MKKEINTGDVICCVTIQRLWKKKQSFIKSLKSLETFHYNLFTKTQAMKQF